MSRPTHLDPNWVRDSNGVAHAIRQSDGDHHSALCGKYIAGEVVKLCGVNVQGCCRECLARVSRPAIGADDVGSVPTAVERFLGGKHWNGARIL